MGGRSKAGGANLRFNLRTSLLYYCRGARQLRSDLIPRSWQISESFVIAPAGCAKLAGASVDNIFRAFYHDGLRKLRPLKGI
jgi:hypothetical protein